MIGWQLTSDESRNTFRVCTVGLRLGPYLKKLLLYSPARYVKSLMKTLWLHIFVIEPSHRTSLAITNKYQE